MTRSHKALTVILVAALGLWGCAQGSNGDSAERIRQLENDCTRLKDDYRAVAGARDRLRQQVADLDSEREKLQKEIESKAALVKERDELLSARTVERDAAQGQLDQVRKGLRSLLGQTEAALASPAAPAVSATVPATASKS